MAEKLSQDRVTQQELRDKFHSMSCQLAAREAFLTNEMRNAPTSYTMLDSPLHVETLDTANGKLAFGPAAGFSCLPEFCRCWLPERQSPRLGELSSGLNALLMSLLHNPLKPAIYAGVKYLPNGTDDFAMKAMLDLDPEWTLSEDGDDVLDFERLRNRVTSQFPEGKKASRICGIDTGTTIDIKPLPFVGDPAMIHIFSGRLTSKVVFPFDGYWTENISVMAVPEVLDDPAFQCRWSFEKLIKDVSKEEAAARANTEFLPVVCFYALTHPGGGGRYMVQEVSTILNRQKTAVAGLEICSTSLHGWMSRRGNLDSLNAFLN